jgi:uncharacterized protein involved in exopolysaccharide biosynthesis
MTNGGELQVGSSASSSGPELLGSRGELSPVGALNVVMRHRWLMATAAAIAAVVTVLVSLVGHRTYTSVSSFMPQSRRSTPSLAGIAAQFGLFVPGSDASEGPAFYADLVTTREILGAVTNSPFEFRSDTGVARGTLVQLFEKRVKTDPLRKDAAIRDLREQLNVNVSLKTGVVELRVTSLYPDLAQKINGRILELVNAFNMERRQTQAASERRFTEQRLGEVRQELRNAEDLLRVFLERNRDYRNSPQLSFQQDRLAREVAMQQQIYTTLAQAYEQAKIEEVRDTPVITVIEEQDSPAKPDSRGILKKAVIALLAGGLLGLIVAFGREAVAAGRAGSTDELSQFSMLRKNLLEDMRHPWRATRRRWIGRAGDGVSL